MSKQARRIEYIRCVDCKAEELDRQGYSVKANIGGWGNPPVIEGSIPDIRAKRGDKVIIGIVIVEEELGTVNADYKKLIDYADRNENTSFRVYMASEDGKPRLQKIYS
jgi:hypothetical protein